MSLYQLQDVSLRTLTTTNPIAVIYGGTGVTTSTGTGSTVLSTGATLTSPTINSPTFTSPILGTATFNALTLTGQSGTTFTYGGNNIYSYGITFTPHAGGAQLNLASYGAMNLFTLNTLAMSIDTTQVVTFPVAVVSPIGDFTTINSTTINTTTTTSTNASINTISSSSLATNDAVFTNSLQQLVSNPISGSGSVAMTISPVFTTPSLGEAQFADLILNGTTGTTFTYDGMSVYTYGYQMRNEGGGNSAYISSYGNQRFFVQDALQFSIGTNGISTNGTNYFQYSQGTWTPTIIMIYQTGEANSYTIGYNQVYGRYEKIGTQVTVNFYCNAYISSTVGHVPAPGFFNVGGLPYEANDASHAFFDYELDPTPDTSLFAITGAPGSPLSYYPGPFRIEVNEVGYTETVVLNPTGVVPINVATYTYDGYTLAIWGTQQNDLITGDIVQNDVHIPAYWADLPGVNYQICFAGTGTYFSN